MVAPSSPEDSAWAGGRWSGVYTVGLEVIDEFRSVARDTMLLTVNLPSGCPSL